MGNEKAEDELFCVFLGLCLGIALTIFVGGLISDLMSAEYVTVYSKVDHIDYYNNLAYPKSYYTVYFEDGSKYNIHKSNSNLGIVTDFDDSSNTIVELRWSSGWFSPNDDNIWGIVNIIKY